LQLKFTTKNNKNQMQKIQTFIWLNNEAEEAARIYTSVIKNSKILSTMPGPGGKPMGVTVELGGRETILFNGGPTYHPADSVSFTTYFATEKAFCRRQSNAGTCKISLGGKIQLG
jgi:predicted 3-demethylubiquinone-9 3-methyltransferase (glyoxalase superfamily)